MSAGDCAVTSIVLVSTSSCFSSPALPSTPTAHSDVFSGHTAVTAAVGNWRVALTILQPHLVPNPGR